MENNLENKNNRWNDTDQDTELNGIKPRRSLERYLEGWTVRETLTETGNIRRERIYVGDYYSTAETKMQSILRKLVYCLLFVASLALFVLVAIRPLRANYVGYVGFSQGMVMLAGIWLLCSLFTYVTAAREMTVGDYKSGAVALRKSSFCMILAFALPALATLVHLCIEPEQWSAELLSVLGYLVCSGIVALIHFAEKKLVYNKRPSPDKKWAADDEG